MRAYLMCILVVVFYSGNILVGKALADLPPFTIAFLRVAIAFVVLLPFGYRGAREAAPLFRRHFKPLLFMTVTGVAAFTTFLYAALQFTSATNVSVLEAAIPAVTVALSAWLLREKLRWIQLFGVALSLFGSVWVVLEGQVFQLGNLGWNAGDALMVGAVASWALYSIGVRKYLHLFPSYGSVLVMSGLSVLMLLPFMAGEWLILGVPDLGSSGHWWGLVYLGVFPSVVALILYNRAVAILGASQASVYLNFLPVGTMLGAYFLLGETITAMQVLGAGLVIAGVLFTTRAKRAGAGG
ncbi:DMT family transporter [Arthrobacter sp. VKM Ac-2550]|uniref:DMT family transporter n=1 Tax=Crystallibacter permensis TaxID=1938888 RepID=UPI0022265C76|nr:DMT family transporter [Arthrobacter sp. VKM Ac-2550]MCW2135274.1 EamA domain-containing membrane protein RarD [Arthrobacter sp. VKM Ac-2550]